MAPHVGYSQTFTGNFFGETFQKSFIKNRAGENLVNPLPQEDVLDLPKGVDKDF